MSTTSPRSAQSSAASAEGSPSPASASRIDERIAERIAAVLPEDRWTKRKMAEFLRTLGATQTSDLARAFWRSQRRGGAKKRRAGLRNARQERQEGGPSS